MTYEFRCADAGAPTCAGHLTASNEDELRDKLLQHLARHEVTPNATLVDHLVASATVRGGSNPPHP